MNLFDVPTLAVVAVVCFFALGYFLFAWDDPEMIERITHSDDQWSD